MGWPARITIAIVVLLILGAMGLAIYASSIPPPHHHYEETLSNTRFSG